MFIVHEYVAILQSPQQQTDSDLRSAVLRVHNSYARNINIDLSYTENKEENTYASQKHFCLTRFNFYLHEDT